MMVMERKMVRVKVSQPAAKIHHLTVRWVRKITMRRR